MNKKCISVCALLTFIGIISAQSSITETESLFERLGGKHGIAAIVDDVIEAHMNNPAINARFKPYLEQPEHLKEIRQHTIEFFSAGSGAPVTYTGKGMVAAHTGMNISAVEYMHVIDDIMGVLEKHNIDVESKKDVLAILWMLKNTIIAK